MNKGKKINGNVNLDSPEMEQMRKYVVEQELSARSWKAYYEKMYYALEAEKLQPLYAEYQERAKKKLEEDQAKMEAFQKALQEEIAKHNEADPIGVTKLEEGN